ncbi:MAG: phytanoyl-CoA dioxygenase family protein [Acetobacteraceae bacterium]|nr:phytanoyl-CoA dioxygenase family protein [Acetobacteraceae bacterium]
MPAGFNPDLSLPTLWTDTPNAMDRLRGLYATGSVDDGEAGDLAHFIEHGWLVWDKAIEEAAIDQFVADLHNLHTQPGYYVSTDFAHGRAKRLNGPTPDRKESFFDLYVNLQSSRAVCMHPRIARFLSLVFQAKPLAFQQLLFQTSNGHGWHQDTAYVVVDSPMLLVATWIALEDIVEGTGELAFYDGSQRLPHYIFANGRKHYDGETSGEQYVEDLERECQARQFPYRRLLAKKGDVFFWTADLVHRSHPQTPPGGRSRLACVTHYCPATSAPHWFSQDDTRGIEPYFHIGGFASSLYKLPNLSQVIRPIPTWDYYE